MTAAATITARARTPRHLFTVALLGAAGLSAWAAYLSAHATTAPSLHAMALTQHRLAHALTRQVRGELASEYRAVRPADADAKAPPIPPSETWPAQ